MNLVSPSKHRYLCASAYTFKNNSFNIVYVHFLIVEKLEPIPNKNRNKLIVLNKSG